MIPKLKKNIRKLRRKADRVLHPKAKVFCISMQRNGTTSVGEFLQHHGYRVARYGMHSTEWSQKWHKGDYEAIFRSKEFRKFDAYEDNPWWFPDFYRVIHCRFPSAKFILFTRDPDKWFDSMLKHEKIYTLMNNYTHNRIYQKLDLFYDKVDNDPAFTPEVYDPENHLPFDEARDHYLKVYNTYNREVLEYFTKHAPGQLFITELTDPEKWVKLGAFLRLDVKPGVEVHANKSTT